MNENQNNQSQEQEFKCRNEEIHEYKFQEILVTQEDHEKRIKELELNKIETKLQLAEIQKSQMKLELTFIEQSKEQSKTLSDSTKEQNKTLADFTKIILESITTGIKENNKTKNKIKLKDRKEIWALVAIFVTALITYSPQIIKFFVGK